LEEANSTRGVGGVVIAGGVGSLIHLTFSSIIIGVYEILYVCHIQVERKLM